MEEGRAGDQGRVRDGAGGGGRGSDAYAGFLGNVSAVSDCHNSPR